MLLRLLFAFAFALHLSFMILKASKLKKRQRQRKNQSPDPAILGRVRTRDPDPDHFVRILIPGPATDPHLRIRSPVLASGARTTGLILHFLNGLFDMNFYLEKVCLRVNSNLVRTPQALGITPHRGSSRIECSGFGRPLAAALSFHGAPGQFKDCSAAAA